jgi:hypothetical protein
VTKSYLSTCLSQTGSQAHLNIDEEKGMIEVSEAAVSFVRWQAIKYLNLLESVLSAWRHNVADREMIEEQFAYLSNPQKGYNAMAKLREVMGGHNFPAIDTFINEVRRKSLSPLSSGKPPLNWPPGGGNPPTR